MNMHPYELGFLVMEMAELNELPEADQHDLKSIAAFMDSHGITEIKRHGSGELSLRRVGGNVRGINMGERQ